MQILLDSGMLVDIEDIRGFDGRKIYRKFQVGKGHQVLYKPKKVSINNSGYSKEFCYFLGTYLGDGNMDWRWNSDKTNQLNVKVRIVINDDAMKIFKDYLNECNMGFDGIAINGKFGVYHNLYLKGKGVREHANFIYNMCGKSSNKHIPDFIFNDCLENRLYFIAGLFDTDGSVGSTSLEFYNKNFNLVSGLARLLNELNFNTHLIVSNVSNSKETYKFYTLRVVTGKYSISETPYLPLQLKYKLSCFLKIKRNKSFLGFNLDPNIVSSYNEGLSGISHDYLKCRLREYVRGHRKTVSYGMLDDLFKAYQFRELKYLSSFTPYREFKD